MRPPTPHPAWPLSLLTLQLWNEFIFNSHLLLHCSHFSSNFIYGTDFLSHQVVHSEEVQTNLFPQTKHEREDKSAKNYTRGLDKHEDRLEPAVLEFTVQNVWKPYLWRYTHCVCLSFATNMSPPCISSVLFTCLFYREDGSSQGQGHRETFWAFPPHLVRLEGLSSKVHRWKTHVSPSLLWNHAESIPRLHQGGPETAWQSALWGQDLIPWQATSGLPLTPILHSPKGNKLHSNRFTSAEVIKY